MSMLTVFMRDQAFAIAWLALMAAAWFGWAQEDPEPRYRRWLGAGSGVCILLAIAFGLLVWRTWSTGTALEGRYWLFGLIVAAEVVLIGGGCFLLAQRQQARWYGWWIGLCVALHFIPLAWVFKDWSYLALTVVQVVGLVLMVPALRRGTSATSRWVGPWIGGTFMLFGLASCVIFLGRHGYPF